MNGIDFYRLMRRLFGAKVNVASYVNPLFNAPEEFSDVQFILPNGTICPPFRSQATSLIQADPLAGPFYALEVQGFTLCQWSKSDFVSISSVVNLPNGNISCSCPFVINETASTIIELLKEQGVDMWYRDDDIGVLVKVETTHGMVQARDRKIDGDGRLRL